MSNKGPFDPDFLSQIWGFAPEPKPTNVFDTLFPIEPKGPLIPGPVSRSLADLDPKEQPVHGLLPPPTIGLPFTLGRQTNIFAPPVLPPPPTRKEPPVWGIEYTRKFLKGLLRRRPLFAEGRVLPKLEDLAVMEGRQIEAAFVYTDLDSFTKIVAAQPAKLSFVLLQAFVELVTRITAHYGGAVVDCAGDRLLSVFHRPAKNYSEEPVHQAITAAFWIQTMLQASGDLFAEHGISAPSVGIGIDYGSVTVGCVGIRNNKRLIFLGNAANNAAKLQGLAGPGETVISHAGFLRKPEYLNNWVVQQEGLHVRVKAYFEHKTSPAKPD